MPAGCTCVEKPLAITLQDADAIVAARDAAGRVVQVGYNNRFDRACEQLADELPPNADRLRYVSVVVHDPEFGPYFALVTSFAATTSTPSCWPVPRSMSQARSNSPSETEVPKR